MVAAGGGNLTRLAARSPGPGQKNAPAASARPSNTRAPLPPVADPDKREIPPDDPALVMPVVTLTDPLTPAVSASEDCKVKAPLLVPVPLPDEIETEPPVAVVLVPALTTSLPPAPVFPLPTTTLMLPPAPLVASPELTTTEPDEPLFDLPLRIVIAPLVPSEPADAVKTVNEPDEVVSLLPLDTKMLPPVDDPVEPAATTMRPPLPCVPAPTSILTLPPTPELVESPVDNTSEPLLPDDADPDLI